MASFNDIRAKMNKKYGDPKEKDKKKQTDPTQQSSTTPFTSNFSTIRSKMDSKYNPTYSYVNSDFVSQFVNDARNYLNSGQSRYEGMGWGNRDSVYADRNKQTDDLRARSWDIRQYLEKNKNTIAEADYNNLVGFLDDFDRASVSIDNAFYKKKGVIDNFETEDAYNQWYEINSMSLGDFLIKLDEVSEAQNDVELINSVVRSLVPIDGYGEHATEAQKQKYNEFREKVTTLWERYGKDKYDTVEEFYYAEISGSANGANLIAAAEERSSGVAYTTEDGQNITWQELYEQKAADEDLSNRLISYAQNADWHTMSKGIDVNSDPDRYNDFLIVDELSRTNVAYDKETALANGTSEEKWNEIDQKRRYIGNKYGVDLYADIYDNGYIFSELLMLLDEKSWEGGELSSQVTEDRLSDRTFKNVRHLTADERAVLNYIFYTQGRDAALKWHNSRMNIYQKRANGVLTEEMFNWGRDSWGDLAAFVSPASLASVALSVGSGFEYVFDLLGGDRNNTLARASSAIRSGVSENTDWEIGNFDAFDFIYNTAMSGADSLAASLLPGKAGSVLLGLSAAAQASNNALDRGLSNKQAFWIGLTSGIFEVAFERISIGEFKSLKAVTSAEWKEIAKNIAKSMLVNFSEEATTEIANIAFDIIASGDLSQYETMVRQFEAQGFSPEDARSKAFWRTFGQVIEAGASGALMGLGFGGIGSIRPVVGNVAGAIDQRNAYRQTGGAVLGAGNLDALTGLGSEIGGDEVTKAMRNVEKKSSAVNVGKLAAAISKNMVPQTTANLTNALKTNGISGDAAGKIAGMVTKMWSGQKVSQMETEIVYDAIKSPKVQAAVEEVHAQLKDQRSRLANIRKGRSSTAVSTEGSSETAPTSVVVADEGTFLASSGEAVDTVSISKISGNNVTVTVNGSTETSLDDISWNRESTALAYQAVTETSGMTPAAANTILSNPKASETAFLRDALLAYTDGLRNDRLSLEKRSTPALTDAEKAAIFNEGRKSAQDSAEKKDAEVKSRQKASSKKESADAKKGGVFFEYDGKTISQRNDGRHKPLTKRQRVAVNFTERLAKKFGTTVYFYESYKDENGNLVYKDRSGNVAEAKEGFYDPSDGSIHIDLNRDNVLFTVSHELVHFIKDWSPVQFQRLADLVMEGFNRQGVTADELIVAKQADYAESGITLTEEQAFEEVIAASLEGIMADGRVMELMREAEAKDKGLGAKLRQFFQDIGRMIRDTIDSYKDAVPGSPEGRLIRKLEDIYSQLQEAFAEGVMDTGTNFQNAENTTNEGGVRFMSRNIEDVTKDTVKQDLTDVFNGKNVSSGSYIPLLKSTPFAVRYITGYKIDRPVIVDKKKSYFDMRVDGKFKEDRSHHYHGMGIDGFIDALEILDDPEFVIQEEMDDGKLHYAFISTNENGEEVCVVFQMNVSKSPSQMNGYAGGYYNLDITEFVATDEWLEDHGAEPGMSYKDYLLSFPENSIAYNRSINFEQLEKARNIDSGSAGLAASHINNRASGNKVPQPKTVVKQISSTDSDGNQLSAGQQSHFSKSQERDADGHLRVMYRGDSEEVTVYDRKKSKPSNLYGRGFYYTSEKSQAGQYGIVRAFYLNTVNPLMPNQHNITKEQMLRFLEAIENDGEDYDLYNYGEGATAQSVLETVWGKGDFEMLQDVSASAIGDLVAVVELFNKINGTTYDSIRLPTETVIFNSNQAKLTTNKNPTDHPDIRYSIGQKTDGAVQALLEKENDALREDVARLKDLLKLQGTQTHGTRFTASSVEAAARYLKQNAGAKGDTKALTKLLNGFYENIASNKELTWDDVREKAKPIANWLMDHVEHGRSDYAQEILDQIKGNRVYLDESQMEEAAYRFGSYDTYRKSLMGSITLAKDADMSLDSWWREMSTMYPDVFDPSATASNMPSELADIIDRLRNENTSALEYEYNRRWIEQDLIRDVYDSYWRVNNLRTVADRYAARINRLKSQHTQKVNQLKTDNRQKVEELKSQHRAEVEIIRNAYRSQLESQRKKMSADYQESRKKAVERRRATELCNKIRRFKQRLQSTMLHPTDGNYIPQGLFDAMMTVLDLVDTDADTDLYRANGEINKAQLKRDIARDSLHKLAKEYRNLKTGDSSYSGEFDQYVLDYIEELAYRFSGRSIKEMDSYELGEMYEILKSIADVLADARRLIGWSESADVYDAADSIASEQNAVVAKRRNGKRSWIGTQNDKRFNMTLSPVRNVERMSGYNEDSALLRAFRDLEAGMRKKNLFTMQAYKLFESVATGKEYEDALYKPFGKEYTDDLGRRFRVSKMQMMQAILSYEREKSNINMRHVETGGFSFADLKLLEKSDIRNATSKEFSHHVPAAVFMVGEFNEALKNDEWAQAYMAAARTFFNSMAKDAINEASMATKHRIIAKGDAYIPFVVDQAEVVKEISSMDHLQTTINDYGMLKETRDNAQQALIITGLNNSVDRHIEQVGAVYGLSVPVRNFNKIWNTSAKTDASKRSIKGIIETNWGKDGVANIEQAVKDVQGRRMSGENVAYQRLKSNYIGATFLLNGSVVAKQIASMFSATSMIRWRDPFSQFFNLAYTMAFHKKIAAEVDQYTATAWMRRKGLSNAELSTMMTEGKKWFVGKLINKIPAVVNPTKWISAMDHAVALSLWKYCKQDVARETGLKGEDLLKATAEFYDSVIERTQSVNDSLHRPEIQKGNNPFLEPFALFKTDLYQMAGQLNTAAGRAFANPSKKNAGALVRTVYAIGMSALWGQAMTVLFAILRHKVNRYRDDEDGDVTVESVMNRALWDIAGDLAGYIFPMLGGEVVGLADAILNRKSANDMFSNLTIEKVNKLVTTVVNICIAIGDPEKSVSAQQFRQIAGLALDGLGLPASNIQRIFMAVKNHVEDIANRKFLSFDAGYERSASQHTHRIAEALDAGDMELAKELFDDAVDDLSKRKALAKGRDVTDDDVSAAKSGIKSALGEQYRSGDVSKELATKFLTEFFGEDEDDIYWIFDKWDYSVKNGSSDGYGKYNQFYAAVKSGKDLKAVIARYTDNGVTPKTLAGQITGHFKPIYLDMSPSERVKLRGYLINAYVACGVPREDAAKKIAKWTEANDDN